MGGRHAPAVLLVALLVTTGCSGGDKARTVSTLQVKVGQCVVPPSQPRAELSRVQVVDCAKAHTQEAYALIEYVAPSTVADAAAYPGAVTLKKYADGACAQEYEGYVGVPYADSTLFLTYLLPSARGWQAGDRVVTCFATTTGERLTRSVHDSKL